MADTVLCRCCGAPVAFGATCEVDGTVAPKSAAEVPTTWTEPVTEEADIAEEKKTSSVSAVYKSIKRSLKK